MHETAEHCNFQNECKGKRTARQTNNDRCLFHAQKGACRPTELTSFFGLDLTLVIVLDRLIPKETVDFRCYGIATSLSEFSYWRQSYIYVYGVCFSDIYGWSSSHTSTVKQVVMDMLQTLNFGRQISTNSLLSTSNNFSNSSLWLLRLVNACISKSIRFWDESAWSSQNRRCPYCRVTALLKVSNRSNMSSTNLESCVKKWSPLS